MTRGRAAAIGVLVACACARHETAPRPATVARPAKERSTPPALGPPEADAGAAQPEVPPMQVDFSRWSGIQSLCHPDETWNEERGCLPSPRARPLRCGSERDERTSCSCRPDDLICAMRCKPQRPPKRVPHWEEPAPQIEHADCEKQCQAGHAPSCLRLGVSLARRLAEPEKQAQGIDFIERSCRLGYGPACSELFQLYRWLPASRTRDFAARLEESRCTHGPESYLPCAEAAEAYRNGWGVTADRDKATRYRDRACNLVTDSCARQRVFETLDAEERAKAVMRCVREVHVCPES